MYGACDIFYDVFVFSSQALLGVADTSLAAGQGAESEDCMAGLQIIGNIDLGRFVLMSMNEPIRIAEVMGKMVGGGLESVVMNYYRHIDHSRVQFDFIVDEDSTLIPYKEIESLGGHVFVVPPYQHVFAYQRALITLFRAQGWQIVHSHENALSVFPLRAAKIAGIPIRIAHSHSTAGKGEPVRNMMKWVLRRFANVYPTHRFACSRHAGEWLFGKNVNFDVIYNAIDLSRFKFNPSVRAQVRSELGISDDTLVIGHIGRFVTQKNHNFLLQIFNEILQTRDNAVLVLAGDGPLRHGIEQKAQELGFVSKVRFLGQRNDANRLYQAFDVFCLPSLYEGLGIVAVEAQVSGLPCLLSTAVPSEVEVSEQCSFLSLHDSAKIWARSIEQTQNGETRSTPSLDKLKDYDIESAALQLTDRYIALYNGRETK